MSKIYNKILSYRSSESLHCLFTGQCSLHCLLMFPLNLCWSLWKISWPGYKSSCEGYLYQGPMVKWLTLRSLNTTISAVSGTLNSFCWLSHQFEHVSSNTLNDSKIRVPTNVCLWHSRKSSAKFFLLIKPQSWKCLRTSALISYCCCSNWPQI